MPDEKDLILIFIDGLGIAPAGENNPLTVQAEYFPLAWHSSHESIVSNDFVMVPTDASLGVSGRPQSASGQTTILTGVNAPKFLGYHKQGFPNQALRDVIKEHSLFLKLRRLGLSAIFANAYAPQFFRSTPRWKSATTCAVEAADMSFLRISDLMGGFALYHDLTNQSLFDRGHSVPVISIDEAADNLVNISRRYRFTLFEHFLTDKIGHDRNMTLAGDHLSALARFVRRVIENSDPLKTTLMVTSDHGNIEDLSSKNHTLNKVPTFVWGYGKDIAVERIKDLADITPFIVDLLDEAQG